MDRNTSGSSYVVEAHVYKNMYWSSAVVLIEAPVCIYPRTDTNLLMYACAAFADCCEEEVSVPEDQLLSMLKKRRRQDSNLRGQSPVDF